MSIQFTISFQGYQSYPIEVSENLSIQQILEFFHNGNYMPEIYQSLPINQLQVQTSFQKIIYSHSTILINIEFGQHEGLLVTKILKTIGLLILYGDQQYEMNGLPENTSIEDLKMMIQQKINIESDYEILFNDLELSDMQQTLSLGQLKELGLENGSPIKIQRKKQEKQEQQEKQQKIKIISETLIPQQFAQGPQNNMIKVTINIKDGAQVCQFVTNVSKYDYLEVLYEQTRLFRALNPLYAELDIYFNDKCLKRNERFCNLNNVENQPFTAKIRWSGGLLLQILTQSPIY